MERIEEGIQREEKEEMGNNREGNRDMRMKDRENRDGERGKETERG